MNHTGRAAKRPTRRADSPRHRPSIPPPNTLRADGLVHAFPRDHCLLGMALWLLNDAERAIMTMQTAFAIHPAFIEAHEELAECLRERGAVPASVQRQGIRRGVKSLFLAF